MWPECGRVLKAFWRKRLGLDRVGQGKAVQYRSRFITDLEHDFVQFAVLLREAVGAPFMREAACAWNKRQRSPGQPDDVSLANKIGRASCRERVCQYV